MRPRNSRYLPLSGGGTPGLLEYQGCRPSLAEGGGPSADGVSIPAQCLGSARGGQAPAQEPQCVPPFSLPGVGARYILLRTLAKSNCHPSKSGFIPLIPITIPTQSAPSPDAMPP